MLYRRVNEDTDPELPNFIDTGKAYAHLIKLGVAKKADSQKHLHEPNYLPTSDGKNFIKELRSDFECDRFNDAPLDDKDEFDRFLKDIFEGKSANSFNRETLDEILSSMLSASLNEEMYRNGVRLALLGYKKIHEDEEKIEYCFEVEVLCERCEREFVFKPVITFYSQKYSLKPLSIETECPNCGLMFRLNPYFQNWGFEED